MKTISGFFALVGDFRILLTLSVVVALAAFGTPWLFDLSYTGSWMPVALPLSLAWVVVVLFALIRLRARGLWLLLGMPLAIYWPFALLMITWVCAHNTNTCP